MNQSQRETRIVRTSVLGILANLMLAGFKAAVGLLSSSIAVVLDAVNNLSDALSSLITLLGARLAGRKPDKKHPLGHGRAEYLSAMIVAALVIYAGVTALVESVKKMFEPQTPSYGAAAIVILAVSVGIKLLLGLHFRRVGKQVNSGSLIASGTDALSDVILSAGVLACALVYLIFGLALEPYVGAVISLFIAKNGVEMLMDTLNDLLGRRVERETLDAVRATVCEDPDVLGAYDLILHSYGPGRYLGSVHAEVRETMTAEEIDAMSRRISQKVYQRHGILLEAVGIYAINTAAGVKDLRDDILRRVSAHEGVLQIHGFHVDEAGRTVHLDVVLDFALPDRQAAFRAIRAELQEAYPDYEFCMTLDIDF